MHARRARVVLLGSPGALEGLETALAARGASLRRIETVRAVPLPSAAWIADLGRWGPVDEVVVTSRAAVSAGVVPWRRSVRPGPGVRYWAVGPTTARALRAHGCRSVHAGRGPGASDLLRSVGRGRSRVLRLRSDRAGPALARSLRGLGHPVLDVVVYRTVPRSSLTAAERSAVVRADLLVATSPSALDFLRRSGGSAPLSVRLRARPLVVLGDRSRAAARRLGFRRVRVLPAAAAQRFTPSLLDEVLHDLPDA